MRKLAHYFYSDGNELQVFVDRRRIYIRDQHLQHPLSPIDGVRRPHPGDGSECGDWDYEALGLYYGYAMAGIGWDGDC